MIFYGKSDVQYTEFGVLISISQYISTW